SLYLDASPALEETVVTVQFAIARAIVSTSIRYFFGVVFLSILLISRSQAQTTSTSSTDGSTPLGLSPGAPAGAYALSGFDNINPYNGNLNFRLPLLQIGGRGGAQYAITLAIDAKSWRVRHARVPDPNNPGIELDTYYPTPNWWTGLTPGYSPGVLQGRRSGIDPLQTCPAPGGGIIKGIYQQTLTRLTFTSSDGT